MTDTRNGASSRHRRFPLPMALALSVPLLAAPVVASLSACGTANGMEGSKTGELSSGTTDPITKSDELELTDGMIDTVAKNIEEDEEILRGEPDTKVYTPKEGDGTAASTPFSSDESVPQSSYDSMLATYDKAHKDGDGSYVGIWYRCRCPEGYALPAYVLSGIDGTEEPPEEFVASDSPALLASSHARCAQDDMWDYGAIWLDLWHPDESADVVISYLNGANPYHYSEQGSYDAATGISYRIFAAEDDGRIRYVVGEWKDGCVGINCQSVDDEALHEFLDGFEPVDDPDQARIDYLASGTF